MISPRARAALAYVAMYATVGSFLPYMPLYYRSLGFSIAEVGSILALGAAVGLLGAPVWGALSDRFEGSPLVLVTAAATALTGTAILAFFTAPAVVIVGAAVFGAGLAGFSPIIDARALENAGADRSGFGPLRAWGSFSYIVAVLGTGLAIDTWGLRTVFIVLANTLVVTAFVGLNLRPIASHGGSRSGGRPSGESPQAGERRPPTQGRPSSAGRPSTAGRPSSEGRPSTAAKSLGQAGRLFGPRGLGIFLLGAFLTWLGMSAVLTYTPIRFNELGAKASIVGMGGAIAAGIEVPLMLRFPWLASRWGSERLLIIGSLLTAVRGIVAWSATDSIVLLSASIFGGLGYALFAIGGITYVSEHVPPELAATAQGIFQGVGNSLSQVVAAALGGAVAAVAGVSGLFLVAAGIGFAAAAIIAVGVLRGPAKVVAAPRRLDTA